MVVSAETALPVVVGVRFRRAGKIYHFDAGDLELGVGDYVVVETARGLECGQVVVGPRRVAVEELQPPVRRVVRLAREEDLEVLETNRRLADEALALAAEAVERGCWPLRVVAAEYTFDRSRLTVYFRAEQTPDLRDLLRELGQAVRARVELRQIGERDEAKLMGGLGPCGRILCCTSFLPEFQPVSVRMAKEQDLPVNPSKLTGLCGRLKCCLRYEHEAYAEARALLPPEGAAVRTPRGPGRVVGLRFLERRVRVLLEDQGLVELDYRAVEVAAEDGRP